MLVYVAKRFCRFAGVVLLLAPSLAGAQVRVEQGREVLETIRAMHRMIDFGGEALDPNQLDSLTLAANLAPTITKEEREELGDGEWCLRSAMLHVEKLGRDMIAGKPISEANAKILDEHFKVPIDPLTGLRIDKETARNADEFNRTLHRQMAAKLTAGQSLAEDECVMRFRSFRSGDQLAWRIPDLSFDVAAMLKAYPTAEPKSKHAMRMLLGLRGKADKQSITFMLDAMRGSTPIERYDAAIAVGQMHPASDKLISALIDRLDDPDPRVARAATRSLLMLDARQSASAMLRRLRSIIEDKASAALAEKLGFGFDEYNILNSCIGFCYDLPTELMFALGRFRHNEAAPLLWEVVKGKGEDVWQYEGIYEMDHGGVAVEAIAAMDPKQVAATARRVLALDGATVDAMGSGANLLGECGELEDVPILLKLMVKLDAAARRTDRHYGMSRAMSRITFAAERLVFFADTSAPRFTAIRRELVVTLRNCASGPFGESLIAALEDFDPDHVEATALTLAADTKAEPNARRIAIEILGRSRNIRYVEPLMALFEDDANATNPPLGLHAGWAVSKILAAANRAKPKIAVCVRQVGDKLERIDINKFTGGCGWEFHSVLIEVDSDRGVRVCSRIALDGTASYLERSIAVRQIAEHARPNPELATPLRPLLDFSSGPSRPNEDPLQAASRERDTNSMRANAARAMARLLGLKWEEKQAAFPPPEVKGPVYDPLAEAVRKELDKRRGEK